MSPRPKIGLDLTTILEAAGELADQKGIYEVTLANLAKRLDIRPPSLYNHFDGLTGLRKQLAIFGINKLYSELVHTAVGRSGEEAILELSKTYIQFSRKHPGIYDAALLAPDMKDPDVQAAGGKIVDLVVRVLQAYDLKGDGALHAVRGLRSILHGFSSLEQKGGFELELDLETSLLLVIKAFIAGFDMLKKDSK
jgi:AcrR family transcriptional regulator